MVPDIKMDKLDAKYMTYLFLGYCDETKAYKLCACKLKNHKQ